MMSQIFDFLSQAMGFASSLFLTFVDRLGAGSILIGGFLVYAAYRFLLVPIIGGSSGSSDKVKKNSSEG